ncbi:MAG: KH domain-containing protein [Nanoarchaeota archaeon]
MTQEIYIENIMEVLKNKNRIQKELNVKITNKGKLVFIDGQGEKEYLALKVLEAVNLGFSVDKSLLLKDEEIILQTLNIKNITKRNDLERVRARIIGTHGKTIANLSKLTDCHLSLNNNQVGIIGNINNIEEAMIALRILIQGSKQGNVYARLEKKKRQKRLSQPEVIKNEMKKK